MAHWERSSFCCCVYLTGVTILIGGEVNALIEQAAARAGDPEAKAVGEKSPDENAGVDVAGK